MGKNGAFLAETAKGEMPAQPVDLESVEATITSYRSVVSKWLKSSASNNTKIPSTLSNSVQVTSQTVSVGRPARLGIGAKLSSQKEQITNSVFLNESLRNTLTGKGNQKKRNAEAAGGSFMTQMKKQHTTAPHAPVKKSAGSDDEDSRSKSLGKASANSIKLTNKKGKR